MKRLSNLQQVKVRPGTHNVVGECEERQGDLLGVASSAQDSIERLMRDAGSFTPEIAEASLCRCTKAAEGRWAVRLTYGRCSREPVRVGDGVGGLTM